jgi:hypothetical protein
VITALVLGPRETRAWLFVPGFVAIALSISSVVAEPRELLASLVLGAAPLMGLAAQDASSWMIGPLAVLLLMGGELNAWGWELGGSESTGRAGRRRIVGIMRLATMGLVASLAVSVAARSTSFDGLVAVGLAAAALAGLGWVILPGERRRRGPLPPS